MRSDNLLERDTHKDIKYIESKGSESLLEPIQGCRVDVKSCITKHHQHVIAVSDRKNERITPLNKFVSYLCVWDSVCKM